MPLEVGNAKIYHRVATWTIETDNTDPQSSLKIADRIGDAPSRGSESRRRRAPAPTAVRHGVARTHP